MPGAVVSGNKWLETCVRCWVINREWSLLICVFRNVPEFGVETSDEDRGYKPGGWIQCQFIQGAWGKTLFSVTKAGECRLFIISGTGCPDYRKDMHNSFSEPLLGLIKCAKLSKRDRTGIFVAWGLLSRGYIFLGVFLFERLLGRYVSDAR